MHYLLTPTDLLYFRTRLTLLPQWVMERTHHVVDSEEYVLNEHPRGSHEEEEITRAVGIHLASTAEKKRLWLRNAALNALFIALWLVNDLQ